MKKLRLLFVLLSMFALADCKAEQLVTENLSSVEETSDSFDISLVIFIILIIAVLIYEAFSDGFAIRTKDEKERVLIPRSERSKRDKLVSAIYASALFCIALSLAIVSYIDIDVFNYDELYFLYLSACFFAYAIFALRYRRSFYVMNGKIARNICDVGMMFLLMTIPFSIGYIGLAWFILFVLIQILGRRMSSYEVIKH